MSDIFWINAADLGFSTGTSHTAAYTSSSALNRCLWFGVAGDITNDLITGLTYAGAAAELVQSFKDPFNDPAWLYLFRLFDAAPGVHNVVVSASAITDISVVASEYGTVEQSGLVALQTQSASGGNNYTDSLPIPISNCWRVLIFTATPASGYPIAGPGSVLRAQEATHGLITLFDSGGPNPSPGTFDMSIVVPNSPSFGTLIDVAFQPPTSLCQIPNPPPYVPPTTVQNEPSELTGS